LIIDRQICVTGSRQGCLNMMQGEAESRQKTAVQALHATFAAEALAHWAEVLKACLSPPPAARRRSAR
jgi:hypothetical protein